MRQLVLTTSATAPTQRTRRRPGVIVAVARIATTGAAIAIAIVARMTTHGRQHAGSEMTETGTEEEEARDVVARRVAEAGRGRRGTGVAGGGVKLVL